MKKIKKLGEQMKIIFFLVTITSFGIFALAGCGKTSENTNTAATKNEEPANKVLKPGDVSPDKAIKIPELVNSVAADKDAWRGKEVTVTGDVIGASTGDPKETVVTMVNDPKVSDKTGIDCPLQGATSNDVFRKCLLIRL